MIGARIPAWTRAATIAVALAVSIAVFAVAWIAVRPLHRQQIVSVGSGVLNIQRSARSRRRPLPTAVRSSSCITTMGR